ncbi:MAG: thioredoxin family protein [Candidatus Aminicenantales bacterium]
MKKTLLTFFLALLLLSPCLSSDELLGTLTKDKILKHFPEWKEVADSYFPKPEVVEKLSSLVMDIHIEVVLGTWCPDSKEHVSAFFKIMEVVDNPLISFTYIGIPRNKEEREKYVSGKKIEKVPTFIVYVQNREKGRIVETPAKSVEEDLLEIITH